MTVQEIIRCDRCGHEERHSHGQHPSWLWRVITIRQPAVANSFGVTPAPKHLCGDCMHKLDRFMHGANACPDPAAHEL